MKFTIEDLKKLGPCKEGLWWYEENIESEKFEDVIVQVGDHCWLWSIWLFRALTEEQNKKIALFCAKEVLPIFEAKHPNDFGPRQAIEAAENFKNVDQYVSSFASFYTKAFNEASYASASAYAAAAACDDNYTYFATRCTVEAATASINISRGKSQDFKKRVLTYVKEICEVQE
jgi:hypothetical protein